MRDAGNHINRIFMCSITFPPYYPIESRAHAVNQRPIYFYISQFYLIGNHSHGIFSLRPLFVQRNISNNRVLFNAINAPAHWCKWWNEWFIWCENHDQVFCNLCRYWNWTFASVVLSIAYDFTWIGTPTAVLSTNTAFLSNYSDFSVSHITVFHLRFGFCYSTLLNLGSHAHTHTNHFYHKLFKAKHIWLKSHI